MPSPSPRSRRLDGIRLQAIRTSPHRKPDEGVLAQRPLPRGGDAHVTHQSTAKRGLRSVRLNEATLTCRGKHPDAAREATWWFPRGGCGGSGGCGADHAFNEGVSPSKLTDAPIYGGRVPVDTTPGPAPMCGALKNPPLILANTAQGALSPAIPALHMSLQGISAKLSFWPYRP